jgi:hypothetical protein
MWKKFLSDQTWSFDSGAGWGGLLKRLQLSGPRGPDTRYDPGDTLLKLALVDDIGSRLLLFFFGFCLG